VTADGIRIHVESRSISHVPAGVIRYNRDVIADFLVLRISILNTKRIAHWNVSRPRNSAIGTEAVEQLHIGIIRGIP
jgi:hypothetical protein